MSKQYVLDIHIKVGSFTRTTATSRRVLMVEANENENIRFVYYGDDAMYQSVWIILELRLFRLRDLKI